jgi:hypothetical protein
MNQRTVISGAEVRPGHGGAAGTGPGAGPAAALPGEGR